MTSITGALVIGLSCAIVVLPKLESIQPTTINAASYGGIGLRFVPGTIGLIMKSGKGIELVYQGKRYVFSSDDPEQVLQEPSVP